LNLLSWLKLVGFVRHLWMSSSLGASFLDAA
jgi:hypothetical protein